MPPTTTRSSRRRPGARRPTPTRAPGRDLLKPQSARSRRVPEPVRLPTGDQIRGDDLDRDAVKVVNRLGYSGHVAYLVGGCVRDLLLGIQPKDFDIATDARPRQVKRLFKNSRIIGRRFRLVHITFGRKALEVSTFRTLASGDQEDGDLLIHHDNEFGEPHEDARRRDFTVNGLFYDLRRREVIDYVGGLDDLERGVIRTIGNPWVRLREDPVRMLRAIKFAGRLGFRLADDLYQAIIDCRDDIAKAAPPRIQEEIIRLMNRGGAHASLVLLHKTGFMDLLLPGIARPLDARIREGTADGFWRGLEVIDRLVRSGADVPSPVLWAHLFTAGLEDAVFPDGGDDDIMRMGALEALIEDALQEAAQALRISRRELAAVKLILKNQRYLLVPDAKPRRRRRTAQLVQRDFFPMALLFLRIHVEATGRDPAVLQEWTERWRNAG